jgi:valyl-tRNA synthetase
MSEAAGRFAGLDRFECRKARGPGTTDAGAAEKTVPHRHGVGHCYRCKASSSPISRASGSSRQAAGGKGHRRRERGPDPHHPGKLGQDLFRLDDNIRDWCISRQIWWGHQIPAWTCAGAARWSWPWRRRTPARNAGQAAGAGGPTCWTPGSARPCGPFPPWAGPRDRPA